VIKLVSIMHNTGYTAVNFWHCTTFKSTL